jgi:5S rRNA maturation endonuclease (ribonuclease M5)
LRASHQRKVALEELSSTLKEIHNYVDVILVEGLRDADSLKALGYSENIETLNHPGVNDYDLADRIASRYSSVLVLTDFDEEGLALNKRFSTLLEHKGVKIEYGTRNRVGRLMAMIGVYAIESLDNIKDVVD